MFYSGDPESFEQVRPLVEEFGETASFVGGEPRTAAIREWPLGVQYAATVVVESERTGL